MKITYIHQHFKRPDEPGGSRPFDLASRLVTRGHEVTMICGGASRRSYTIAGIRVEQLRSEYRNDFGFAQRVVAFLRFAASATALALSKPADVVFASSTPLTAAVPALLKKLSSRTPMVFEVRDLWPEVPVRLGHLRNPVVIALARWLERLAYSQSSCVIGLSPAMVDGVLAVAPHAPTLLLPNTAQSAKFRAVADDEASALRASLGITAEETMLLYAGSHGISYDIEWLLEVASRSRDQGVRAVVLGEGTQTEALRARCRSLGLDPEIVQGAVPKNRALVYYAAADAVVSCLIDDPALADNSLNKVFDAYASGTPVIFNHAGWLSDLTRHCGAGWQLSRDVDQAAAQLGQLVAIRPWTEAAAASRGLASGQFDVEVVANRLADALERIKDSRVHAASATARS